MRVWVPKVLKLMTSCWQGAPGLGGVLGFSAEQI